MAEEPNEDLSMDDILSSIRNILMEDNAVQQSTPPSAVSQPAASASAEIAEDISVNELPGIDEDISLLASEDEVFELSPSMIVDDALDEPVLDNPQTATEPEISESDILDLSNLIAPETVVPQAASFLQTEETKGEEISLTQPAKPSVTEKVVETPVFHPSAPSPQIKAPLAAEILTEKEVGQVEEREVSVDDIIGLNSLLEKDTASTEENTLDLSDELNSFADPLEGLNDSEMPSFSIRNKEDTFPEEDVLETSFITEDKIEPSTMVLGNSEVDVEAEPIYEPEISVQPEIDPSQVMESMLPVSNQEDESTDESPIDDETLNEILDFHARVEETKPAIPTETEITVIPEEIEIIEADPTDNIQDVFSEPVIDALETEVETEITQTEEIEAEKQDAADVSANIINNFAKLFAEKKSETLPASPEADKPTIIRPEPVKSASPSISELVREAVVKQVTQQMDVNFESYAREAVAAQTQAWLDANLPEIVEAVVSKEIERVMAKVGS